MLHCKLEDMSSKVSVELDGKKVEFELAKDGPVILDAVMDQGFDAPYSCRGGICTTCKAKLSAGKVEMDQNFALSDGEVEEGYILTCQSHPITDEVALSFDEA